MKIHIRLDIKGALRNKSFKGFTDGQGNPLSPKVAESFLKIMDYNGQKYMKIGECDNWSDEEGCLGHEDQPKENQ